MKKEKYPSNERTRQILQDNLKSIREILNWTSADLGDLIGVTKQTISNLETKNSKLTKLHYIALRTVVDFEIEKLKSTDSDRAKRAEMLLEVLSKAEAENLDFDEIGDSEGNDQITTYSNQVTFLNNGYPYKKWVTDNFKKVISLLNQIL